MSPLLVVQRAKTFEQALQLCNGVRHGLVAALFSNSCRLQEKFLAGGAGGDVKNQFRDRRRGCVAAVRRLENVGAWPAGTWRRRPALLHADAGGLWRGGPEIRLDYFCKFAKNKSVTETENHFLTRVGPGTPMGRLLRQYWIPVLQIQRFAGAGRRAAARAAAVRKSGRVPQFRRQNRLAGPCLSAPLRVAFFRAQRGERFALPLSRLEI